MIDSENKLMLDCHVSTHSAYFEDGFNPSFHKQYKGIIVNARGEGGYGHFAIRKPVTFWFKLPKFIKKMFESYGCEVIVINGMDVSDTEELAADMMSLLASFSGKFYGKKSAERRRKKI